MTSITVKQFSFQYTPKDDPKLVQIDWEPLPHSFNLLIGASGSGKSTLLKAMAGLLPHFGGTVTNGSILLETTPIDTIAPFERAKRIALLFQNPNRQFAMQTPTEQITFALENIQIPAAKIAERVTKSLAFIGITQLAHQKIMTLSGGEKQKVALATILALGSDIILLDEPFANVDPQARQELLHLIKRLQIEQGKTIILADHDLSGYQPLVDHIYQLDADTHTLSEIDDTVLKQAAQVTAPVFSRKPVSALSPLDWHDLGISLPNRTLIEDAHFQLPLDQLGLLSGANGVGKSTLFAALTHQRDYTGQINWHQQDSQSIKKKAWTKNVALVFQDALDQFVNLTVQDELNLSKKHSLLPQYWTNTRIESALAQLNLTEFSQANVYQLSGGQQKKVQVLSMLIMGQPVLLLDEPLAGLDQGSVAKLMPLIKQTILDNHLAALMISHQRFGLTDFVDYELQLKDQHLEVVL